MFEPELESSEIFRTVLESLQVGTYFFDSDLQILFWDGSAVKVTGYLALGNKSGHITNVGLQGVPIRNRHVLIVGTVETVPLDACEQFYVNGGSQWNRNAYFADANAR